MRRPERMKITARGQGKLPATSLSMYLWFPVLRGSRENKDENPHHCVMCMVERRDPVGVVREAGDVRRATSLRFESRREIAEPPLRRLAQ